jgi:hypothetical protein
MESTLNRNVKQSRTVLYSYLVKWHMISDNNRKIIGKYRVSQELRPLLRDLIPELILSQKRRIHKALIGNGSGVKSF